MKTKSLLALAVAGLAAPVAFGAVSSNIVGYTTLSLTTGYNLVANTLNNKTSNAVADLFNSTPAGTAVFRWTGSGFAEYDNLGGTWVTPDNPAALNPGEAVFVQMPSAGSVTLIGEVLTGTQTLNLVTGYNFVASVIPKAGLIDTDLGYAPQLGDAVFTWNGTSYVENDYVGSWTGATAPQLAIGQGIVLQTGQAGSWSQTFTPSSN